MRLLTPSPHSWLQQTDINKYAIRQAQSCKYLGKHFATIEAGAGRHATGAHALFERLMRVHDRQYLDLEAVLPIPDAPARRSFYFEHLFDSFGLEVTQSPRSEDAFLTAMSIQLVSYLRGADRYQLLSAYDVPENTLFLPVWKKFVVDAPSNAVLVHDMLCAAAGKDADKRIEEVLDAENTMMKRIWRRNHVI
jgi:hypothetical protein